MVMLSDKAKLFGYDAVAKGIERLGIAIDGFTKRVGKPHLRPSTYINVLGGLGLAFAPNYVRAMAPAKDFGVVAGAHMVNKVWDYLEEYRGAPAVPPPPGGGERTIPPDYRSGRYAVEAPGGAPEFYPPLYGRQVSPEPVIKNHVRYTLALEG